MGILLAIYERLMDIFNGFGGTSFAQFFWGSDGLVNTVIRLINEFFTNIPR